jgi:predicted RNase H-like nuclease (RuvC/YqgF family)
MELSREALPVKIIDNFSKDGIREATTSKNIKKSDVVLLKSSKGGGPQTASLLIHLGVKAVITTDKMSHQAKEEFQKNMIPLIEEKKVDLKMADDVTVIMSQDLKREIEQWKKEQEEKKKKEDRNKLLKIMDDYRAQRKRSTNNY